MENENLAPDIPYNKDLAFPDEPKDSPTYSLGKKRKDEYRILVTGRKDPLTVRDARPMQDLIKLWVDTANRVSEKGRKLNQAVMKANVALNRSLTQEFSDPEIDMPGVRAEVSDLVQFYGDEEGYGAAAIDARSIEGIVRTI